MTSKCCDELRHGQGVSTWDRLHIFWDLQPLNPSLPGAAEGVGHKTLLPTLQVLITVKLDKLNLQPFYCLQDKDSFGLNVIAFAPGQLSALMSTSEPSD